MVDSSGRHYSFEYSRTVSLPPTRCGRDKREFKRSEKAYLFCLPVLVVPMYAVHQFRCTPLSQIID